MTLGLLRNRDPGGSAPPPDKPIKKRWISIAIIAVISLLGIPKEQFGVDWGKVITNMYTIHGVYGRKMFSTWYRMSFMLQSSPELRDAIRSTITHRFAPEDWAEAFDTARSGRCGKVIFDWSN